jgi:hypothetical protein
MRPAYKPFKTNILSRVVQASEGRYRTTPDEDSLGAFSILGVTQVLKTQS